LKLSEGKSDVPEPLIAFLTTRKDPGILSLVDQLWAANPTQWEEHYIQMGPMIEEPVLDHLESASPFLKLAAIRMLTEHGTEKSLRPLEKIQQESTGELRAVIEKALEAIRARS